MQFSEQECKYITQLQRGASAATSGKGNWASERDTGKGYAILQPIESFRIVECPLLLPKEAGRRGEQVQ